MSLTLAEYRARVGQAIGTSNWYDITQAQIDTFADATLDHQYIHVDPERAAQSPFGGTIAHGFLTLSLLSAMAAELPRLEGTVMGVNYGFEKLRFVSPVRSGARIRAHFTLAALEEIRPGEVQFTQHVSMELEGQEKPALTAEWLTRRYFK